MRIRDPRPGSRRGRGSCLGMWLGGERGGSVSAGLWGWGWRGIWRGGERKGKEKERKGSKRCGLWWILGWEGQKRLTSRPCPGCELHGEWILRQRICIEKHNIVRRGIDVHSTYRWSVETWSTNAYAFVETRCLSLELGDESLVIMIIHSPILGIVNFDSCEAREFICEGIGREEHVGHDCAISGSRCAG